MRIMVVLLNLEETTKANLAHNQKQNIKNLVKFIPIQQDL